MFGCSQCESVLFCPLLNFVYAQLFPRSFARPLRSSHHAQRISQVSPFHLCSDAAISQNWCGPECLSANGQPGKLHIPSSAHSRFRRIVAGVSHQPRSLTYTRLLLAAVGISSTGGGGFGFGFGALAAPNDLRPEEEGCLLTAAAAAEGANALTPPLLPLLLVWCAAVILAAAAACAAVGGSPKSSAAIVSNSVASGGGAPSNAGGDPLPPCCILAASSGALVEANDGGRDGTGGGATFALPPATAG